MIFILSMLPGTFNSILRPQLYYRGLYGFYALTTLISQIFSLAFILLTVKILGIYSFAISYFIAAMLNAILFSFRSGLYIRGIFNLSIWKYEFKQLLVLLKRVFSLSFQTLMNHFATFWERSLSVKYLTPGYLSSLNYSKTITELPNNLLLSSVLTTSYIEQAKLHRESEEKFISYTENTFKLLVKMCFLLQLLMLVFAPVIIILVFRRGRFDNEAVKLTLTIYNILTIGFLPRIIMNYFSRTMYILGEYGKLSKVIFLKMIFQIFFMIFLVNVIKDAIPLSIIAGFIVASLLIFAVTNFCFKFHTFRYFITRLVIITALSLIILLIHKSTIDYYISLSNTEIFLYSLPLITASALFFMFFLQKIGVETGIIKKIKSLPWKAII